ncbi:MAG: surface-adhesin E family protein [Caulobacteraceae bacterium]
MITLLAAAIAVAAGAPPTAQPAAAPSATPAMDSFTATEIEYARTALPVAGWSLLSMTHDLLVFYRGDISTPTVKLWIRGEHYPLGAQNPLGSGESFVTLYELNCGGQTSRTLSSTIYAGAKMQGEIVAASDKPGAWTPLKPGGFTQIGADMICKAAAERTKPGEAASQSIVGGKSLASTAPDRAAVSATPRP